MPELTPQSTPPDPRPFAWEEYPAFRSTFTMHFTREDDRAALEHLGRTMYEVALEMSAVWPRSPESSTQTEMRAAAADLRHLEGFLGMVGRERKDSSLDPEDAYLSARAEKMARQLGRLAEWIETELEGGIDVLG
jgi:hypothetical protein